MSRYIFILLTTLALTACGQETESPGKTAEHATAEKHDDHGAKEEHGDHDEGKGHDEGEGHGGHEEAPGTIHLSSEQMKTAGIKVSLLQPVPVAQTVKAPGEVRLNAYRTVKITPRINAQVIERHAKLGDKVEKEQPLVTLSSVEMAEAQGQLLLADKEWKRVRKLGRRVVSERRYLSAKIDFQKSFANVKAYGMSDSEIRKLLGQKRSADGTFELKSPISGRILHDKFIVGEFVDAGYELMVIADESTMWVEARVTPETAGMVQIGSPAEVLVNNERYPAKVIQLHHTLDETTRTSAVRLELDNSKDRFHAGMFVTALISTSNKNKALQLPEAAVLRSSDGDWQVFVQQEEKGEFKAVEVEVKQIIDGKAVIEGIKPGSKVVTAGAFFIQSEIAKGGFEIHNH